MAEQLTPTWQPSGKVFLVGTMIDGMLENAREQYQTLLEARPRPHVLDDYTVGRLVRSTRRSATTSGCGTSSSGAGRRSRLTVSAGGRWSDCRGK